MLHVAGPAVTTAGGGTCSAHVGTRCPSLWMPAGRWAQYQRKRHVRQVFLKEHRSLPLAPTKDARHWASAVSTRQVSCLLYTSDAADDLLCVDLGGRRI